ncbi:hypothetical protein GGF41_003100, partial [Coemansia sp. RSA 2531]
IELDAWEVYSGEALKKLSVPPYDTVTFPLVSDLSVALRYNGKCEEYLDGDAGFPRDTVYNIGEFVRRIKQMVPEIGKVVINTHGKPTDSDSKGVSYFRDLLSQLFEIAETTAFSDPHGGLGLCIPIRQISNLVLLNSLVDLQYGQVLSLARHCAQTLQHLKLQSFCATDMTGLVQDPDSGECVEYPRLRILELMGNSATLEYLSLAPYQATVNILTEHCVFTPTSHPRLQCVNIVPLSTGTTNDFATATAYLEFVMSIAPGASVRQIADMRQIRNGIAPALSVLGYYASIQVLSLPYTALSLWDTLSLIKLLPCLSDLATKSSHLGELPQGVSKADLPDYVRSNYAPMGERLRCWHISYFWSYDVEDVATVAILLALACPNLDYAAVDDFNRKETLMKAIQKKIDEPGFSQHAPRLSRLLSR